MYSQFMMHGQKNMKTEFGLLAHAVHKLFKVSKRLSFFLFYFI